MSIHFVAKAYGQYCPVALATEILGERWTILVVLALSDGISRFADLQRALPRISPGVLAARLRSLEDAGVVRRNRVRGGTGHAYALTEAGEDLTPVIYELGGWGQRWARELEQDDLDPFFLAWSMHLRMNVEAMPRGRTTLEFELAGSARGDSRFWIIVDGEETDVCIRPPGHEPDLRITADVRRFVEAWRGFRSLRQEIARGHIRVQGSAKLRRAFPGWLLLSSLAHVPRERPGRERSLSRRARAR